MPRISGKPCRPDTGPPWQKTWETGQRQLPRNIESEREYRGGNTLVLMATAEVRGYGDSRWGTYRQIIAAGGQVRKGERATRITLYKPAGESRQQSGDRDEDRDRETEDGRERRAIVQRYAVFNIDQADGIEPERREAVPAWKAIQEVEKVLEKGAPIRHANGDGDGAFRLQPFALPQTRNLSSAINSRRME